MTEKELNELFTAYVDNELDDSERKEIEQELSNNSNFQTDVAIQSDLKSMLNDRFSDTSAPGFLVDKIRSKTVDSGFHNKFFDLRFLQWRLKFSKKPQMIVSYAVTLIITLSFVFNPFASPSVDELIKEQHGEDNMFVVANQNFKKIKEGSLNLQFASHNPNKLIDFFKNEGVTYQTYVQSCSTWSLQGGVVSQKHGVRLAHHLYTSENGNLVYIFQAGENCFTNDHALELSQGLIEYINDGNYLKCKNDVCTYVWKCKKSNNYFTLVTDIDDPEIFQHFIQSSL